MSLRSRIITSIKVILSLTTALGVPFTFWLFICLFSSWEIRSRLKGRLMCSSMIAVLLDLGVVSILQLSYFSHGWDCTKHDIFVHSSRILDFIFNWKLVLLLVAYVAQLTDFDPSRNMTPWTRWICVRAVVITPWVVGLLMYPLAANIHNHYCNSKSSISREVLDALFILNRVVPASVTLVLAGVAVFLRQRQSFEMNDQLRNRNLDPLLPYALIAAIMSYDIPYAILTLWNRVEPGTFNYSTIVTIIHVGQMLDKVKNLLTPAIYLLVPDIREHVCDVTLRLWTSARGMCGRRVSPGIDLTVAYSNEMYETGHQPDEMCSNGIEHQPEEMGHH